MVLGNEGKEMKFDPCIIPWAKTNSRGNVNLKVKYKTTHLGNNQEE